MGLVAGAVALVTGAGSGIGRASATAFAREGARAVVVADLDADAAASTADEVRAAGGQALAVAVDVRVPDEVEAMIERTVAEFGRLDCAHNNAGIRMSTDRRATGELDFAEWRRVIDVNLHGTFLCLRHEIALMTRQRGGAIVNTASIAGFTGVPNNSAYAASKHGVLGLTKSAALEVAGLGIRINAVNPGPVDTPMLDAGLEHLHLVAHLPDADKFQALAASVPLGRVAGADDIANAVVWLCSPMAGHITGESLSIDGGQYAARSR